MTECALVCCIRLEFSDATSDALFSVTASLFSTVAETLETLLDKANRRLKSARTGVTIFWRPGRGKLHLRGIFPPRPDSDRIEAHQQTLAINLPASVEGIKQAEIRAKEIGSLLVRERFRWENVLKADPAEQEQLTVRYWVKQMERQYFEARSTTLQTETTWRTNYHDVYKHLDDDAYLTVDLLKATILERTEPDSRQRLRYCLALAALGRLAGLDVAALSALKGNYSATKTATRVLPTDVEILEAWHNLSHAPPWVRWSFGMIACYGLRPHELYHLDLTDFKKGNEKIRVLDETKTRSRTLWPLVPEGFDLAWLRTPYPPTEVKSGKATPKVKDNQTLGQRISTAFRRWGVPILAYDLRHAWAVRAIRRGLDVSAASRMMGHSLSVHNKTYQRWLTDADLESAYRRSLSTPK
jgi:hypothetical protein